MRKPARVVPSVLSRAREWSALIDGRGIQNRADLAAHLGVSRARVTQALAVLAVPAQLMNALDRAEAAGAGVTERDWRRIMVLDVARAVDVVGERVRAVGNREQRERPSTRT